MVPRREEFILEVRRALRLEQKPTVVADSEIIKPDAITRALQRAALWLTPNVVEKYDPSDFVDCAGEIQEDLRRAVEEFRALAGTIPTNGPVTESQFTQGLKVFRRLVAAVRRVVLPEWRQAVEKLESQAEQWSAELEWPTRRVEKKLTETLLEAYSVPQLLIFAAPNLYVLDPVGRFVPGALGAFDFAVQPSYHLTTLYRDYDGNWYVRPGVGQDPRGDHPEVWTRDSFKGRLEELRALV